MPPSHPASDPPPIGWPDSTSSCERFSIVCEPRRRRFVENLFPNFRDGKIFSVVAECLDTVECLRIKGLGDPPAWACPLLTWIAGRRWPPDPKRAGGGQSGVARDG